MRKIGISEIEIKFGNWKLNSEIGILKNYLRTVFWEN